MGHSVSPSGIIMKGSSGSRAVDLSRASGRRDGRDDKQRGRQRKIRVGELGAHLCGREFDAAASLLGVTNTRKQKDSY